MASLTRNGTGFSIGDRRSYDAWGVVRSQQSGGDPKLRYCASLGHKADDESGLVYMRARYYEPSSGRFVSEDPDSHGWNFFAYCSNDPANRTNKTGRFDEGPEAGQLDLLAKCFEKLGFHVSNQIRALTREIALAAEVEALATLLSVGFFAVLACTVATVAVVPMVLGVVAAAYLVTNLMVITALAEVFYDESEENFNMFNKEDKGGEGGVDPSLMA